MKPIPVIIRLISGGLILASGVTGAAESAATNPPPGYAPGFARPVTIAVVQDGDSAYFTTLTRRIEEELRRLIDKDTPATFRCEPQFSAAWDPARLREVLTNALNDPAIDLILTAGVLAAQEAARPDLTLTKPVVSAFVEDAELAGLPYKADGHSTKRNFNFVVVPLRVTRDLEYFRQLVPFKTLGIVVDAQISDHLDASARDQARIEKDLQIRIRPLRAGRSAAEILGQIDAGVDAIYLTPAVRMAPAEWQQLIDGINRLRKPSFSMQGHEDVEKGVLAGLLPQTQDRLARRLALNLQQIILGTPPESLPVLMVIDDALLINARTARQIGYAPSLDLLIQATFLHEDETIAGERLTLADAVRTAAAHNIELAVKRSEVETVRQERNLAISPLFPQLEGNGQFYQMDRDRAEASLGSQPENRVAAGVTASQVIFSDALLSRYRAAVRLYAGARDDQEAVRLDIVAGAAKSYIQYLQTLAFLRIEADNLNLTRNNLVLARLRHKLGAAGPEEIYRWESDQATRRAAVIRAATQADKARIHLNQVLGEDQNRHWQAADIELKDDDFYFLQNRFQSVLHDERQLAAFEQFTVRTALQRAPTLAALDQKIEAARITLGQARRKFALPEAAASFSYDRILDQKQVSAIPLPEDDTLDDNEWLVGIKATLPLFTGGGRVFDVFRLSAQLRQAREAREQARQLIEQQARFVFQSLCSSFPAIRLQRVAADRARANLDIIKQKYADGSVGILPLLDAQNDDFVARQGAALAVYTYLTDVMELQRVLCWFEVEKTEEEKDAFLQELTKAVKP